MRNLKIIMAGGGTGGHIFPALAIAQALRTLEPSTEILFVGAKGKMEMEKVPEAGYRIEGIDMAGFDRRSLWRNLGLPVRLVRSFFQVRRIFESFKPDAAIGVGGYSTFPVLRYAQGKNIPTFIHESNSFAGKANIWLGRKATRIFVAVDGMGRFFPPARTVVTGNPVRPGIARSKLSREDGLRFFGLDPRKKTVLSIGGSLGSRTINESVEAGLDALVGGGLQLIWQTGKPFAEKAAEAVKGKSGIWTGPFIREMQYAYAAADIIISRAGAMSVAEVEVMGKPAVFVPYPLAAEDHQTANARKLSDTGAALMITDAEAQTKLIPAVLALSSDGSAREEMGARAAAMAIRDADVTIARAVLGELDPKKRNEGS
jgi:UDP-N-acetylglucosamine--N-acetylmuramyl-(pentapeptide) pyrophosphoryl-undecaprenol N-acetylglucosamine transferase